MDFFNEYGPYILLGVFLIYLIGINLYRAKKQQSQANSLVAGIKKGDYIKTYSGFYGTVLQISELKGEDGQLEKVILVDMGENSKATMDIRAIYMVVNALKPKAVAPKPKPVAKKAPVKKTAAKKAPAKK